MKVLIVDDELRVRRTLSAVLKDEGYQVLAVADGEEGLRQALAEEPDVILYDASMPGLEATAFLEKYHASGGQSLVVVTVGYGAFERMVALMNKGAYGLPAQTVHGRRAHLHAREVGREGEAEAGYVS